MPETNEKFPSASEVERLNKILAKANAGDQTAIEELHRFLDDNPQVWRRIGDMAAVAEQAWITAISKGNRLAAESFRRQLAELKAGLLEDSTTTPERMMADTILATWLELHYLRSVDADSRERSVTQTSLMVKRLESAQRRHHTALKDLQQLRKLLPNRGASPALRIFPYAQKSA